MKDMPNKELIEALREGRPGALDELLARHQAQIYRFGLRMCRDHEDARDVLQETLIAMARGMEDFRGGASLSTWLFAIARSHCIKKRRRRKDEPDKVGSLDSDTATEARRIADESKNPDELLEARQVEAALEEAVGALEPKYREVLVLRDIEGLSAPEVAEVLGISVSAVKSRLHRARLSVREALFPFLEQEEPPTVSGPEKCPDVLEMLSRHLEGEIDPGVCAEMERHLESCPGCKRACESLRRSLALCRSVSSSEVPQEVQAAVRASIKDLL